jgi:hypothetical protein
LDDQVLPPFAQPHGLLNDDLEVARAFARGLYIGHSPRFHVEDQALMADRLDAAALRVGPTTVLVRLDLPDDAATVKPVVEQALTEEGYSCLDRDTLLAAAVAIQVLGLRLSSWDLWGQDIDEAFHRLRTAAVGDEWNPVLTQLPIPER